ncbi:MAG: MFS transporter [Gammaproteobacteria bacterium]
MIRSIAPVASLLLGVAILLTGQGLQGVLLPVRATLESFSPFAVGLIGGAYFLGFTVGCWRGPRLIRRAGHVRVFAAMTAIASAAPLLHGLWVNLWSWGLLRLVTGFCFAVLYVVIESWLNERADDRDRGRVFSAYIFINMLGLAIGQQLLMLSAPGELSLFALTSVLISIAAVPLLMSTGEQPRAVEESTFDLAALYRNSPTGMLGSLTSGVANGAFWSLAPVFTATAAYNVNLAAWFMTAAVLGGAVGQWPFGWLSDRVDRRHVLIGLCAAGAGLGLLLWLLADQSSVPLLLAASFAWGATAFPVYTISVAQANDRADPETFVMISSGLLLMFGMGAIIGPLLASALMGALGGGALFLFTGLAHAALALFVTARRRTQDAPPESEQTEFGDALASALTASHVFEEELEREILEGEPAAEENH